MKKKRIKEFVIDLNKPFIGFCLGCQLLGEILGGKIVKSSPPEIGILNVQMTEAKYSDHLFSSFPDTIKTLQWHSYEVKNLESNNKVQILASSPTTKYQIFKYKKHAYGIQCHIEIKNNTVRDWGCIPEYKIALEQSLGKGALEKFDLEARKNIDDMNNYSSIIYNKFSELI